ncbi:dipeptidyl aminopeptidase/acylaminoacyl peptidase [Pedobacter africanus]|uniref:Dipeptidyl aminopeptidase/acylaminoacyl peptidase n=1 Tax=Pedobacter africanus TaxID=151894 RepID=A0ACC6L103_9SPHI|nr:prolyl oligopeptidase family serine peptidase [Pedobacter africanus]MDR6785274.1 dipeptidyl aminopeptidase/acylaminoacyl peptidase [Pedobacter africanus]
MLTINSTYKIYIKTSLFIILLLVSYLPLSAQVKQKSMLTPKDYHLWHKLFNAQISNNGNWASYRLLYDYTGKDTLIVQQTYSNKSYVFPGSARGKFNGETDFACLKGDTLIAMDLKSGKQLKTPATANFAFSANQKFMIILLKQDDKKNILEVRDRQGAVVRKVSDIVQYVFDPSGNGIVYSTAKDDAYSVEFMLFKDAISKKTVTTDHQAMFKKLVWEENSIAFIETLSQHPKLFVYDILQDKLSLLDPTKVTGFPSQMQVSHALMAHLNLSDDGKKVIFWMRNDSIKSDFMGPKALQIWHTMDKQMFDSKKSFGNYAMSDKMAIWDVNTQSVLQITNQDLPTGFLSSDYNYAFIYDRYAYEPQTQQNGPYDLYIVDLKTGKRKLIIRKYAFDNIPSRSPDGRYLCYATKQGHWWIYDIQRDLHTNITLGTSNSFLKEDTNSPGQEEPYGIGGWTTDGNVILYDRYDLWKVSLDGKEKLRLTKGREIQKIFRIEAFSNTFNTNIKAKKNRLDLDRGLILTTVNKETGASGLSSWNPKSGVKELIWENKRTNLFYKAENKAIYMYLEQSFTYSPRLMMYDGKARELVRTNKQQDQFYWGKNERIDYVVNGIKTKGVLFYPAAYEAGKKYPMVVSIYERQFAYLHEYQNPSLMQSDGNNTTNFTHQGYFVLYPDINYEYGNLRKSVTQSVLTAIDTVVAKGSIYPDKIGLIGHSFGGYETDLILTQTGRFTAAVAGAAWTDLVSTYLYEGPLMKRPDFFRTENHQLRIGKSLFEDMPAYLNNSPVLLADKVNTPLLGWAGEDDRHIHSLQSMEFYLALRRANKEHTLLIYSGEEHELTKKENAMDLSLRIMQWFDYYLKDGKKQDWMNSNFNQ